MASTTVAPRTPKAVARARRRIALERFWSTFRKSKMGIAGLVILVFFGIGYALGRLFL